MFNHRGIRLIAGIVALAFHAPAAQAQSAQETSPVVVELYTSQGCSSCPPADALLAELADERDVIALSLHVDYWDYLGWRDIFANPENTRRQMAYRDAIKARSVYTPQIIVNGVDRVVGSKRGAVLESVERHSSAPAHAKIELSVVDGMLEIEITARRPASRPCTVWVAAYHTPAPVKIVRGENAGRTIAYHNVAKSIMRLGVWKGGADSRVVAPIPMGATGMAVMLQEGEYGRIVAAEDIEF